MVIVFVTAWIYEVKIQNCISMVLRYKVLVVLGTL